MFDLGIQELIVIFVVALIVFGPKKLPELGRTLGKGILELKRALNGMKGQLDAESLSGQGQEKPAPPEPQKSGIAPDTGLKADSEKDKRGKENV